jgi:hypothetical protein
MKKSIKQLTIVNKITIIIIIIIIILYYFHYLQMHLIFLVRTLVMWGPQL